MCCDRVQEVAIVAVVATIEHCFGCKDVAGVLSFAGPLVSIYSHWHRVLQWFAAEDWMTTLSKDLLQARENLQKAQERQKRYADKKRRHLELHVGDEVLLSTKYLNIAGV